MSLLKAGCVKAILIAVFFLSRFSPAEAQITGPGDIAFSGYTSVSSDEFSFVLLKSCTAGTVIHFTDRGWTGAPTNAFNSAAVEETVDWTCPAGGLPAGTEIQIVGLTANRAGGGAAGTVTGTAISLSTGGDQVLAYLGTVASPTFLSGIHMNVYQSTPPINDPVSTTAANWDLGNENNTNGSALPPGLTTGVNAIWIGTFNVSASEMDNAIFNCAASGINISTEAGARTALNDQTKWIANNSTPSPGFTLPSGCNFLGVLSSPPSFTTNPSNATVCENGNTSFTVAATGATSYQWQVDNGGGFTNISNNATYAGATTTTLNLTNVPASFNGYQYRCVATGSGSTNSTSATLTVTALPVNPTLLAKTPNSPTVADGTPVSATFNAGSGGSGGCTDDYRYTTNGGATYLAYTPGSNISTTGLAAGSGFVFIEGRRAGCASCSNSYVVLASWVVTPLPAGATTLNAGDIAFTAYSSTTAADDFSFVLLKNIGPGTAINFTDNGWLSTNVLQSGEETITWTSNAAYSAGTEIMISGLTATLASGGSAGTVTGTPLNLSTGGDQILAYRGTAASPTFISAIHMNVYSIANGDPVTTTAAAWDGTANTLNSSALPTGLTTGINAIWIGTQDVPGSEFDNSHYGNCAGPGTLGPIATLRATLNNQANWISDNSTPPGFSIPTGCPYLGVGITPPTINTNPANTAVCETAPASFSITATNALTYQWQEDQGSGFNNLSNSGVYSGVTTTTLTISAAALSMNGYTYRCVASNGGGSTNSTAATLTVNALPASPTLLAKTPATITVADGTPVSATFNAGSGGTGCSDDFRYTTDGGATYLPYTPGSNISTTGVAGGSGFIFIEGRRANCSAGCQGVYKVLAMWRVTPIPVAATTLNAGDIAFSAYTSTSAGDDFSFVLLKNVGPGTTINFTDNGWLSTNVFGTGEQTVTWTAPAGGLPGGTEITISGLTATRSGGGAAGTVTGTALSLSTSGDQILAYRGTAASPTFISAIHMNVYTVAGGDPTTTTAAAWDGAAPPSTTSSALPTGLTTGLNCIWIGTQGDVNSEHNNAKYGNCTSPAINGSLVALRAALNNQANWIVDDNTPPSFTQPTGCNYLSVLCPTITVTNPAVTTGTVNVAFSQTFTATGGSAPYTFTTASALPTGLTLSSAGVLSGTPTQGGTFPIVVVAAEASGCSGTGSTYNLVISCPAPVLGTATPASQTVCSGTPITNIVLAGAPAGSVYNWTRDNAGTVTGIAASGSGDITGTLTNTTAAPITVTFTITPVAYGSCNQTSYTATVLVNPTPDAVPAPGSQSICSGSAITTIAITGATSGTVFNWTRDNTGTVTGIAASGSGDISGSLTNTTNAPVTVTFTITPTANGCTGTPATATVVVNPIPDVTAAPASQSVCSGALIQAILMSGSIGGTAFDWTRDNVGTIGGSIPASGSGNIVGTLVNNTGSPVTVTFTITPNANGCAGTPVTATVTVNPLPVAAITGAGVDGGPAPNCENPGLELSGATSTGTGLTYAWGRSLFTNPFTPIGTAQTQPITNSGNYLLTVTNTYGCIDTAMRTALVADYIFNGSLTVGDQVQTGRLNRFATISTCAAPKGCPGIFTATGSRLYDSYTIVNPYNVPVCATIGITSYCGTNIFCAAYLGSYNNTSQCTNYLADPGSSFTTSGFYEATIPANGTMVVVVHEVNPGTGCANYRLSVHIPREGITVSAAPPYCSGSPITLTAPPANSYSWTPGGATTQVINVTPPAGTTNYKVTSGFGNWGCVGDTSVTIVAGSTPDVTPVANQYFCAGTSTPAITLAGSVPGTIFNWTNTNTAIGLAASGTGNIPSFLATNATAAPISGTITVTPVNGPCTGTPFIFTISVSPVPSITSVTGGAVCAPGGIVNLSAAGTGTINWWSAASGGIVVNTGTTYSPNITATSTFYVEAVTPAGPATLLAMPGQSSTFPGNVRGYWFTAPTNFVITSLSVPTTASSGPMSVAVVKFTGNVPPPIFSATTNAFTTVFQTFNNPTSGSVPCNIPVATGEVIGILGYRGNINSYAPGDYVTSIAGFPVQLERLGMQFPLTASAPHDLWREFGPTTSISRVEFTYSSGQTCNSAPRVPVTATLNPAPVATATPSAQTVCSGPITTIVLSSTEPGTTYTWTRDNTVNVTGIPSSGSGASISGTLTNNTFVPQTVTFTITPTSGLGCVGAPITATVLVQSVPTATCPANITVSNDLNQCGAVVSYVPTITGVPVPAVTYVFSGATTGTGSGTGSGSFFNIGITSITITATNVCGTASCSFTVTVNDTQNPAITCPAPVTVSCASAVPAPDIASVTASDNCPGVVVTHMGDAISNQTCANRYTITRTYRATDIHGNFSECTQTIIVNDQTPPTLTCPAPITVSCTAIVPAPDISAVTGVSDNCGGAVTITWQGDVISNQTCANRYTITRTYRATDVCGNFAECTQTITVNDQTPPVLTCPPNITVSCASAVPAANIASVTGVSDNCGGAVTVTWQGDVISNQTCANRYTITRTYRATDVCGNFAECTQIITVNDQTPPVITCPAPVTVSCASAVPAPNTGAVTATDNCGGAITITWRSDVISNQTCANRYTITRTYRATDVCGNFAECTQIITVNDQTPPTLTCPAPVTVSCASAVPAPNISLVTGVSDNCGGTVTITWQGDAIINQTCTNRYTVIRTYRATDVCGNFAECTQTITVNDQTPPVLTCPAPITVSCTGAVPTPDITQVTGVSDNCGGPVTVTWVSDVISNQTCASRYIITRTYRATDACGNFAQCTQLITVYDQTPPTLTCPATITVSCASAVPAPDISLVTGVSDNCGGPVTVTWVSDVISNQSCANRYSIARTYRATDPCGNFAQCVQIINVNDQTGPVITCPSPVTVNTPAGSCTAVVTFTATATDNCGGGVTITTVPASGSAFPIGNNTVTVTATDVCGNISTCTFVVTVRDGQLPVITQQPVNAAVCVGLNTSFSVAASTSPNAGGPLSYQWQVYNGNTWNNIPGATGTTLALNNVSLSMNNNLYRVLVTGLCTTVISDQALLRVNPLPTVILQAQPYTALLPPQYTSIIALVSPQGGTFNWSYNGTPLPVSGNIVTPIKIDNLGAYQVVYTDPNSCVNTSAVLNITAAPSYHLWVYPSPNNGRFTIRFYNETGEQATVKVYSPVGQEVFSKQLTLGVAYTNIPVDLGSPAAGIYTVKVVGNGNRIYASKKIVIFVK
ncbi:MAG: PKD-like domain-containing protein [Chitinophagaceae bacterium]